MRKYEINSPILCIAITAASKLHYTKDISIESQLTDILRTSYCIFEKVLVDDINEPKCVKIIIMIEVSFPQRLKYIPICIELENSCYPRLCPKIYIPPTFGLSMDPYCTYLDCYGNFSISSFLQWNQKQTLVALVKCIHNQFDYSLPILPKYKLFYNEACLLKHLPLFSKYEMIQWSDITNIISIRESKKDSLYKGYIYNYIPVLVREFSIAAKFHNDLIAFYKSYKDIDHPNMGEIYGYSIHDKTKFCIITEYSDSNLPILLNTDTLSILEKQDISLDICRYLRWMHNYSSEPLLHRDFYISNIYMTESGTAKVFFPVPKIPIQIKQSTNYSFQISSFPNSIFTIPNSLNDKYSSRHEIQLLGNIIYELFSKETIYDKVRKDQKNTTVESIFQNIPSCIFLFFISILVGVQQTLLDCWNLNSSVDIFIIYNQIRDWNFEDYESS